MTSRLPRSSRDSSAGASTRIPAPSATTSTTPGRSPSRSRRTFGMTSRPALSMVALMPKGYQRRISAPARHNPPPRWPSPPSASIPGTPPSQDGRLRSAAATRSSSRASSARPAYVVAEDDLRARARASAPRCAAPTTATSRSSSPPRRSRAPRSAAVRARRAWPATSPRAASCTSRCAPASTPQRDPPARQREVRGASCAAALEAGVGDDRARQLRRHRPPRAARPGGRRQRVLLRVTPGVDADTHDDDLHRPAPTRSSASPLADAPAAIERLARLGAARARRPAHAHRLADLRRSSPFRARARGDRRPRRLRTSTTSAAGSASPTRAERRPAGDRGLRRRPWSPPRTSCSGRGRAAR